MARYKFTLAYDGAAFYGSQRQARRRTVQAELEKAVQRLGWKGSSVVFAGRTDAGVHAAGQVAAVDLEWAHGEESLRDAVNAGLPPEVVVTTVEAARQDFHPRFDAVSRRYRYDVRCAPLRHPLDDRFVWRVWPAVEPAALDRAARLVLGTHDFGAFGSAARKGGKTVRTVEASSWRTTDRVLSYEIVADGFLYRMVRRLVFLQVAVGQGKCSEQALGEALRTGARVKGLPAGTAPADGLRLMEVKY
jgi:tRNA pseudouridine38-40 synthase